MRILIARLARGLYERSELTDWLITAYLHKRPQDSLETVSVDVFPTPCARHAAVREARRRRADLLCMVDHDMIPAPGFLNAGAEFLLTRPSAMVGSPYRSGWPEWGVHVWRGAPGELRRVTNDNAAGLKGILPVAAMGLGLVIIGMPCFDLLQMPYFDYEYGPDHDCAATTEDIYFTRNLARAGGTVYCDWSRWSKHAKTEVVDKPEAEELWPTA